jgi:hypothetical protein
MFSKRLKCNDPVVGSRGGEPRKLRRERVEELAACVELLERLRRKPSSPELDLLIDLLDEVKRQTIQELTREDFASY